MARSSFYTLRLRGPKLGRSLASTGEIPGRSRLSLSAPDEGSLDSQLAWLVPPSTLFVSGDPSWAVRSHRLARSPVAHASHFPLRMKVPSIHSWHGSFLLLHSSSPS